MSGYKRGYFSMPNIDINSKNVNFIFFYFTTQTQQLGNTSGRVAACLA
jgi:hypothetical protein